MFKDRIELNPAFAQMKEEVSVHFSELYNDATLFMTMACLLFPRVERVKLESNMYYLQKDSEISDCPINQDKNIYSITWIETDKSLDALNPKGTKMVKVEEFVKKKLNKDISVRIYPKFNSVVIAARRLTIEFYHFMISLIPSYFQIFRDQKLNGTETELCHALTLTTPIEYKAKLAEIINQEAFSRLMLRYQFVNFEKKLYAKRIKSAEKAVDDLKIAIDKIMQQYKELFEKKQDAAVYLAGLQSMANDTEEKTELCDYLANNKCISNVQVEGTKISFIVKTFLMPYHIADWENMSAAGMIFRNWGWNVADSKLLLDAIFSDSRCLKVKMCAAITMDYYGSEVNARTRFNFSDTSTDLKHYMPNPHLNKHNCFGQNKPDILSQLRDGDIIGAIECCINCVKHVNINESITFRPFISDLLAFRGKCIVTEDGTEMTPASALTYLKEKGNG